MQLAESSPTSFSVVPLVLKDDEQSHWLHFVSIDATAFEHWHAQHRQWLHSTESSYYESITSDVRRSSFLLGRIVAKSALTRQLGSMQPEAIEIRSGLFQALSSALQQPTQLRSPSPIPEPWHVHWRFLPPTHGIDLEDILPDRSQAMERQCSESELAMVQALPSTVAHPWHILWTSKEALSKAIGTGFTNPIRLFGSA